MDCRNSSSPTVARVISVLVTVRYLTRTLYGAKVVYHDTLSMTLCNRGYVLKMCNKKTVSLFLFFMLPA